jgi:hypothetical protein
MSAGIHRENYLRVRNALPLARLKLTYLEFVKMMTSNGNEQED